MDLYWFLCWKPVHKIGQILLFKSTVSLVFLQQEACQILDNNLRSCLAGPLVGGLQESKDKQDLIEYSVMSWTGYRVFAIRF